jgi:hypothetical protein
LTGLSAGQGFVLSSVERLQMELNRENMYIQGYNGDMTMLITGKFPNTAES